MNLTKSNFLVALSILTIIALGLGCNERYIAEEKNEVARPNIILCMTDDQGWGDTAYNGHPFVKTPNLDAMAEAGIRFDHFYAAGPVCSPTRASVLTGRHPNRMGVVRYGLPMRPQETTIAEALKQSGYVTGHFGKWHLGSVQKTSPVNPGNSGFDEWLSSPNYFDMDPILSHKGVAVQCQGESSAIAVDAALEFIREQSKADKPFLAVVWFAAPHVPLEASDEDLKPYVSEGEWAGYFAELTAFDRAFGKLRDELTVMGIKEDTILWYNSDNGGMHPDSTGGRAKKGSIYEGGLRVPAILEWPKRFPKPQVVTAPCNTSDIYPTLLEITGTRVDGQFPLDGISLMPILQGTQACRTQPMGFWQMNGKGRGTSSKKLMAALLKAQKKGNEVGDASRLDLDAAEVKIQIPENDMSGHAAWIDWPWKLHRIENEKGNVKLELYNLVEDPYEKADQSKLQPERVGLMKAQLEDWQTSVVQSHNGQDYQPEN